MELVAELLLLFLFLEVFEFRGIRGRRRRRGRESEKRKREVSRASGGQKTFDSPAPPQMEPRGALLCSLPMLRASIDIERRAIYRNRRRRGRAEGACDAGAWLDGAVLSFLAFFALSSIEFNAIEVARTSAGSRRSFSSAFSRGDAASSKRVPSNGGAKRGAKSKEHDANEGDLLFRLAAVNSPQRCCRARRSEKAELSDTFAPAALSFPAKSRCNEDFIDDDDDVMLVPSNPQKNKREDPPRSTSCASSRRRRRSGPRPSGAWPSERQ